MAKSKGSTDGVKRAYKRYENEGRYAKNKKAKLDRHIKAFPNDDVAKAARKNVRLYVRKAPKTVLWSKSDVKDQMLFGVAAILKDHKKGEIRGGDVRKIREKAIVEINLHKNESSKAQKESQKTGVWPKKNTEHKTNMFRIEVRARYV